MVQPHAHRGSEDMGNAPQGHVCWGTRGSGESKDHCWFPLGGLVIITHKHTHAGAKRKEWQTLWKTAENKWGIERIEREEQDSKMINLKQNIVKEGVRTKKQAAVNKVRVRTQTTWCLCRINVEWDEPIWKIGTKSFTARKVFTMLSYHNATPSVLHRPVKSQKQVFNSKDLWHSKNKTSLSAHSNNIHLTQKYCQQLLWVSCELSLCPDFKRETRTWLNTNKHFLWTKGAVFMFAWTKGEF